MPNAVDAASYWETNEEWFKVYIDPKTLDCKITLTDKAPEKARKSFYEDMKENNNGKRIK